VILRVMNGLRFLYSWWLSLSPLRPLSLLRTPRIFPHATHPLLRVAIVLRGASEHFQLALLSDALFIRPVDVYVEAPLFFLYLPLLRMLSCILTLPSNSILLLENLNIVLMRLIVANIEYPECWWPLILKLLIR
jgi:hypothetical protein